MPARQETVRASLSDQSILKQIESLTPYRTLSEIQQANRAYPHDTTAYDLAKVFNHPERMLAPEKVIELANEGLSGVGWRDGNVAAELLGRPILCRDVRFVKVEGARWEMPGAPLMYQPFKTEDDAVILPLVGGIHSEGNDLMADPQTMEKLPVSMVKTDDGSDVKYPAFVQGGRSILMPLKVHVPGIKNTDGGFEIFDLKELEGAMDQVLGTKNSSDHKIQLERQLKGEWERESHGLGWEQYKAQEWERTYFLGAFQVFNDLGQEVGKEYARMLEGVAVQIKGVGNDRYMYHAVKKNPDGTVEKHPDDKILRAHGRDLTATDGGSLVELAQRQEYEGKDGIFTDIRHQYYQDAPTGGLASAKVAIERDRLLLSKGARMSGITMGYARLLTRQQLMEAGTGSQMVCDELVVSLRVILDDTHRLDMFKYPPNEEGKPSVEFELLMKRETGNAIGDFSEGDRDKYLDRLSDNIGHNLKVVLDNGLTATKDQDTMGNLSIYGGILDTESFTVMRNKYQGATLVDQWYQDMMKAAVSTGMSAPDYLRSGHFRRLAMNFMGGDGGKIADEVSKESDKKIVATALRKLKREWVKKALEEDGNPLTDQFIYEQLKKDEKLRDIMGVSQANVRHDVRHLLEGKLTFLNAEAPAEAGVMGVMTSRKLVLSREQFFDMARDAYVGQRIDAEAPILAHGLEQEHRELEIASGIPGVNLKKRRRGDLRKKKKRRR
ncbi:hypothetical protein ACFLRF_06420 [Candidatus Altiarchaeota archaeon]